MSGGYPSGLDLCNGSSQGVVGASGRGTAITAANGSYGSYTQLVASTAADTEFVIVSISTNESLNAGYGCGINIAIGAAASEVIILPDLQLHSPNSLYYASFYAFPVCIPAGTRISASANGNGGADTFYVDVKLFDASYQPNFQGADSIGAANAGSRGTSVTAGAANTKGSYTQLTASSTRDYSGIAITLTAISAASIVAAQNIYLDIAIGGAGSEVIIIPDLFFTTQGAAIGQFTTCFAVPVNIPAATRIAARLQSTSGSNSFGIILHGVYQ